MADAPTDTLHSLTAVLGGVGLFLLGMTLLTEGLKALAGPGIRGSLQRVTARPARAFGAGMAMTVASQASSATVLATIGFVTAGMLSLASAMPIIAGATVGTSSTTWFVATLGLSKGASVVLMPFLALGALMRAIGHGRWRHVGTAVAGLTVLLLSIAFIRTNVAGIAEAIDLGTQEAHSIGGRAALVGIGALLAIAMQSSASPIALSIVALHGGIVGWDEAAHLAVGATVGTTSTGLLATIGTRAAARQAAIAWIACAAIQAAAALLLYPALAAWSRAAGGTLAHGTGLDPQAIAIAAFHTSFAMIGAVPVLLAPGAIARLVARAFPERGGLPRIVEFDRTALEVPGVAAATARRGLAEAGTAVCELALVALRDGDAPGLADRIENASASLESTRTFMGEIQVPEGDRATVEMQRGTIGALDHLARLVGDVRNLRRAAEGGAFRSPAVRAYLDDAASAVRTLRDWLRTMDPPCPLHELRAASASLGARRKAERSETLNRTAAGATAPDRAIADLDALRYADRMAHHAAKAAAYLAARTNGATPHASGGAEPTGPVPDTDEPT